jgi:hypothetical protein
LFVSALAKRSDPEILGRASFVLRELRELTRMLNNQDTKAQRYWLQLRPVTAGSSQPKSIVDFIFWPVSVGFWGAFFPMRVDLD